MMRSYLIQRRETDWKTVGKYNPDELHIVCLDFEFLSKSLPGNYRIVKSFDKFGFFWYKNVSDFKKHNH